MRARGIDISHYQENYDPVAAHDFCIVKASEGLGYDEKYKQFMEVITAAGLIRGAYHYFRSGIDVNAQVDTFLEITDGEPDFYGLDFEKRGNNPSAKFANNAKIFVDRVKSLTGKPCLFYSNPSTIQEWMFQIGVYWVRQYEDLWISQWPYSGWNDQLKKVTDEAFGWKPWLPAGCTTWTIWQYSADYNAKGEENGVSSRDVDMDVYNGSVADMQTWLGLPVSEPIEEEKEVVEEEVEVVVEEAGESGIEDIIIVEFAQCVGKRAKVFREADNESKVIGYLYDRDKVQLWQHTTTGGIEYAYAAVSGFKNMDDDFGWIKLDEKFKIWKQEVVVG